MSKQAQLIIEFVDRRQALETDGVSRNITIEMVFDHYFRHGSQREAGEILQEIQTFGRNDVFKRFSHIMNIEPYDLDLVAMKAVEQETARPATSPRM